MIACRVSPLGLGLASLVIMLAFPCSLSLLNATSIAGIQPNLTGLTITSFVFNHDSKLPAWVRYVIGDKSVFLTKNATTSNGQLLNLAITADDQRYVHELVEQQIKISEADTKPACSIELLGYVLLDQNWPFVRQQRNLGPIVGKAALTATGVTTLTHACYYRAMYENWRVESDRANPNHWSTFFYCPVHEAEVCQALVGKSHKNELVSMSVRFTANQTTWFNDFTARISSPRKNAPLVSSGKNGDLAVCLSIPYTTVDADKHAANGAILQEWIRYYLKLGMKILIFDRDGANYEFIRTLDRVDPSAVESGLAYYDYTIRGLVDPSMKGVKFDNNEHSNQYNDKDGNPIWIRMKWKARSIRFEMQGHDKVLTLTHCRFEAKSLFGIENTMIADYDEFLYCPAADAKAASQATAIRSVLARMNERKIQQVAFVQRVVMNVTASTRDCIVEQARAVQGSVFNCFAPYKYVSQVHSIKSVYIGHVCPLTGYHQACPISGAVRVYDCQCAESHYDDCQFIHLSTNNLHFKDDRVREKYSKDYADMTTRKNEIYTVIYGAS